ncbi:hypothetical protein B0T12DRAFT_342108 [Alternaria alternata]|nr:hypothetical protein B0T12DRAFT_342108 [Alternaria alternata]
MNSSKASSTDSIAQDASFAFWFPVACTLVGVLFTIFAFLLAFYTTFRRPTPVLLEILTELRKSNGDPRFQSWLRPVSFQVYLNAQAAVLARERKQANSSPFPELD